MTDLENAKNMFIIADCHDLYDMASDMVIVKTVEFNATTKAYVYKCASSPGEYVLTFTPFDFKSIGSFIRTGVALIRNQHLVNVGGTVRMNCFFNAISAKFINKLLDYLQSLRISTLHMTGISMGGAMAQCFYYHACRGGLNCSVSISTFGAPRIGNLAMFNWFRKRATSKKNPLVIKNYALFKLFEGLRKIDPVCLFPASTQMKDYRYCNNYALTMIFDGGFYEHADYHIDQPDTNITFRSLAWNFGLDVRTAEYWDKIHDIGVYFKAL